MSSCNPTAEAILQIASTLVTFANADILPRTGSCNPTLLVNRQVVDFASSCTACIPQLLSYTSCNQNTSGKLTGSCNPCLDQLLNLATGSCNPDVKDVNAATGSCNPIEKAEALNAATGSCNPITKDVNLATGSCNPIAKDEALNVATGSCNPITKDVNLASGSCNPINKDEALKNATSSCNPSAEDKVNGGSCNPIEKELAHGGSCNQKRRAEQTFVNGLSARSGVGRKQVSKGAVVVLGLALVGMIIG